MSVGQSQEEEEGRCFHPKAKVMHRHAVALPRLAGICRVTQPVLLARRAGLGLQELGARDGTGELSAAALSCRLNKRPLLQHRASFGVTLNTTLPFSTILNQVLCPQRARQVLQEEPSSFLCLRIPEMPVSLPEMKDCSPGKLPKFADGI